MKQLHIPAQDGYNCVHAPIVVDISEGNSAVRGRCLDICSRCRTDIFKLTIAKISENGIRLRI